jgi:hypothetical protein
VAEEWKVIPFFTAYEVSDLGRVKRRSTHYIRSPYVGASGYPMVLLSLRERRENHLVHRLVARAFLGEPPTSEHEVAHGNGNRRDNRLENLRWATPKENGEDKVLHGSTACGERNGNARLPNDDAEALLADRRAGLTQRALAKKYGISQAQVWNIVHGKQRRHPEVRA